MSKKRKASVPKRIGGVKVPKAVRRGLKDLAASQSGKAVLTEALLAAGAVLAAHEAKPGSKTRRLAAKHAPELKAALAEELSGAKAAAAERLQAATRTFTEALRTGAPTAAGPEAAPPAE
jgi:hypothetical protein